MNNVHILDCTLRDGSYSIDFQFTAQDTWLISSALEQAGIEYIEIGHGLGLGASRKKNSGVALESDESYCKAIAGKLKSAKWGTFFIPGIGTHEDMEMLSSYGADFVRIGTDVERIADSEPFIRQAKKLSLMVFSNFMKSYSVSPEKFAENALKAQDFGSDILVVVDSAGGMMPEEVMRYTEQLRSKTSLPIGFHGHNNLDLASANSLAAMDAGATFIDCSLQGLGRSAGNTITEAFALTLQKKGVSTAYNTHKLIDIGNKFVKPLLREDKFTGISMISGYAQFHSSFLGIVLAYAEKYQVDSRELIVRLCKESQTYAPDDLVERLAAELAKEKESIASFRIAMEDEFIDQEEDLVKKACSLTIKQNKQLVYNLVCSERSIPLSRNFQQDNNYILLNGQGPDLSVFNRVLSLLESFERVIYLVDQRFAHIPENLSHVIIYNDFALWADAVLSELNETQKSKTLYFSGWHPVRDYLEKRSQEFLFKHTEQVQEATVLIAFAFDATTDSLQIKKFDVLYDAVVGGIPPITEESPEMAVIRVNMGPSLFSYIKKCEGYRTLSKRRGSRNVGQFQLVSGGIIGKPGDIVVDNCHHPSIIVGVADGRGSLMTDLEPYKELLNQTQSYITGMDL